MKQSPDFMVSSESLSAVDETQVSIKPDQQAEPIIELADPLHALIESLCILPGVGERTARRMAYHLLQYDRAGARRLTDSLDQALSHLRHCERCNSFTVTTICRLCGDMQREQHQLCVVETPADLNMIEASRSYHGLYYVLMGKLQPLNGVGAQTLGFQKLLERACEEGVQEVILATNFTAEGETTAQYLGEVLKSRGIRISRIARGVPAGSELEYVDAGTIAWAFMERR